MLWAVMVKAGEGQSRKEGRSTGSPRVFGVQTWGGEGRAASEKQQVKVPVWASRVIPAQRHHVLLSPGRQALPLPQRTLTHSWPSPGPGGPGISYGQELSLESGVVLWTWTKLGGPHQTSVPHLAEGPPSLLPEQRILRREKCQPPASRPSPGPCGITVKNSTDGAPRHFLYNT